MSFAQVNREYKKKDEWKVVAVLGEVKKNKTDVLRITRVEFAGKDLINFQVWRINPDTEGMFPLKDQKLSFNIELRDQIIEALKED